MNYQELLNEYSKLIVENNNVSDQQKKRELTEKIIEIEKKLILYRDEQLKQGLISDDLIRFFAQFDAYQGLSKEENEKQENELIPNKYNLSSDYIISELTGETISLVGFSLSTKIELIYEHTGEVMLSDDKVIIQKRNNSFNRFIKAMEQNGGVDRFKELYGDNWMEEVEKRYKSGYTTAIENHIDHISDKVNDKRFVQIKDLSEKVAKSEQEQELLINQISELKQEVSELTQEVVKIQSQRKIELEQYKKNILSIAKNNSNDDLVLFPDGKIRPKGQYKDGTLEPDMYNDERGRYTTNRDNRENETGMQERVNDAAHVHDQFSEEEKAKLQRKYDEVFGAMSLDSVEEQKPKTF